MTKKGKAKPEPKGRLIDCPYCHGSGAMRIFNFEELNHLLDRTDGDIHSHFNLNGRRYKFYLSVREEADRDG